MDSNESEKNELIQQLDKKKSNNEKLKQFQLKILLLIEKLSQLQNSYAKEIQIIHEENFNYLNFELNEFKKSKGLIRIEIDAYKRKQKLKILMIFLSCLVVIVTIVLLVLLNK